MSYKLYNTANKKVISTKINDDIKIKILSGELRILNKKEYGSKHEEYLKKIKYAISYDDEKLPLYDISNKKFFYTEKYNVFYMIKELSFRPMNKELEKFLEDNILLEIMKNYDYDILEKSLLKFIYYDTKDIGANITYFKNPAFIEYLNIRPYLKKSSIVNTALNIGTIKVKNLPLEEKELEIMYNKIKSVFFTNDEIRSHMEHMDKNKTNSLINFYTMYGSFFLNTYLRMPYEIAHDEYLESIIYKLIKNINTSPALKSDKVIFRFVYDDFFLDDISVGGIYIDNSFMSCTRKPGSSSENEEFGQILLKIHLPKGIKGSGLSIESDSVFRREKEVILAPGSKLKLVSIDNDVDFYVFDKYVNRNIRKKYEFKYVGHDDYKIQSHDKADIPEINLITDEIMGETLNDKIKYFWSLYGQKTRRFYLVLPDKTKKLFYCNYYDSTEFYQKFFYYKTEKGFYIFSFDENDVLDCFIEVGDNLILNYPTRFLNININKDIKLYASLICNGFQIARIKIFPEYLSINKIGKSTSIFKNRILFNSMLYNLSNNLLNKATSKLKIHNKDYVTEFLDSVAQSHKVHYNLQKYTTTKITYKKLINIILKDKPENIKYLNDSLPNSMKYLYYDFDPYSYLIFKKLIFSPPNQFIKYLEEYEENPDFGSTSRNTFRRVYV
jgi:hypothetical protein